jgi:membrane-bound metal-dependent hydrolase YbcI (DUF457 family)
VDLLTHVLLAYLLTYGLVGFHPQYLAAGALAGGLPDGDALFYPISRRFPILRHHGITHSLFGVTIVAGVGAVVALHLAPGSPLVYLVVMEAGGISHILADGFTNFSVPPLLPFSKAPLHLDADRAVNFATLAMSIASFYLLLGIERNHVAFAVYLVTVDLLIALYVGYLAVRLAGRLIAGRARKPAGGFDHVLPTGNPFVWLLLSERTESGRRTTSYARYVLGRGVTAGPYRVEGPLEAPAHVGTPNSVSEALEWSYPLACRASSILDRTYHFGEAFPDAEGGWTAVWYSLEFTMLGGAAGVRVRFPPNGGPALVRSGFVRPRGVAR